MKSNDPKYSICWNAQKYCSEDISLIENYAEMMADNTQKWVCHHRRETDENKSRSLLIEEGRYYNVPARELIFLTRRAHMSLHKKGVPHSDEHKQHISEALKGVPLSDEQKRHISEAMNRPEVKKRICTQVNQYTLDCKFLKTWPSTIQVQKDLGIFQGSVCKCCNGKRKSAGGFVWKYHAPDGKPEKEEAR